MFDVVDEGFNGVLVFSGVRWTPLGEDGVFKLSDVALEAWLLWGVEVIVPVPSLSSDGAGPSLLPRLVFSPMVIILPFFVIILR